MSDALGTEFYANYWIHNHTVPNSAAVNVIRGRRGNAGFHHTVFPEVTLGDTGGGVFGQTKIEEASSLWSHAVGVATNLDVEFATVLEIQVGKGVFQLAEP